MIGVFITRLLSDFETSRRNKAFKKWSKKFAENTDNYARHTITREEFLDTQDLISDKLSAGIGHSWLTRLWNKYVAGAVYVPYSGNKLKAPTSKVVVYSSKFEGQELEDLKKWAKDKHLTLDETLGVIE